MKSYSNDVVTPDVLTKNIHEAFVAQNLFFESAVKKQTKMLKIMLIASLIINFVTAAAVISVVI